MLRGYLSLMILGVLLLTFAAHQNIQHGVQRRITPPDGHARTDAAAWVYNDGADIPDLYTGDQPNTLTYSGWLWLPERPAWEVRFRGQLVVALDGVVVYQGNSQHQVIRDSFTSAWRGDHPQLEVSYTPPDEPLADATDPLEMGLYINHRLLPNHHLYLSEPDTTLIRTENRLFLFRHIGIGLIILSLIGLAWRVIWRQRLLEKQATWILVGIVLLGLIPRLILYADRAAHDPFFTYFANGIDNYLFMARHVYGGDESWIRGAHFTPGNIVWLYGLMSLFGPQLGTLYAVNAVLGAISSAGIAGAGWMAFGKRAGILAGVISALFAPLIFYQVTVQPAAIVSVLMSFTLLGGMLAMRERSWQAVAIFGVLAGWTALMRSNMLMIGPAFFLALVFSPMRQWRQVTFLTGVAAISMLLAIAPQTLANISAGEYQLINGNSPGTFYWGNNRDADGTLFTGDAFILRGLRGEDYPEAIERDVKDDPGRVVELFFRKVGLLFKNGDIGNNVSYNLYGLDVSPMLRLLALHEFIGTTLLSFFAFMGLALCRKRDGAFWLIVWTLVLVVAGTAIFVAFGRMRAPLWGMLMLPAGYALDQLTPSLTLPRKQGRELRMAKATLSDSGVLSAALISLALLGMLHLMETELPRKDFFRGDLPEGVAAHQANFNGEIKLIGFAPLEMNYAPDGYVYYRLYWQSLADMDQAYLIFMHLRDHATGEQIAARDVPLGTITYPLIHTSAWDQGDKLGENYLVRLPDELPDALDLYVGVYAAERLLILNHDGSLPETPHDSQYVYTFSREGRVTYPQLPEDAEAVQYQLGNLFAIEAVHFPDAIQQGENLETGVAWRTLTGISEDYVVFFHVYNEQGESVYQHDSSDLGGWRTSQLPQGQVVGWSRTLAVADLPVGQYRVEMGAYSYPSITRLDAKVNATLMPNQSIQVGNFMIR